MARKAATQTTTRAALEAATATTHRIHPAEATDEVCDAIETCLGRDGEGRDTFTAWEAAGITEYIAEQYRTNRNRTAYWFKGTDGRWTCVPAE